MEGCFTYCERRGGMTELNDESKGGGGIKFYVVG